MITLGGYLAKFSSHSKGDITSLYFVDFPFQAEIAGLQSGSLKGEFYLNILQ